MPVYVRKNAAVSPSMVSEMTDQCRDEDFLLDQEQFRDTLPQPYRMVNKVLLNLVDNAWEVIADRVKVRAREESKIRPPKYECSNKLQEHGNAHSICHSRDGEVVFIGLQNGLAAVNAKNLETLDIWQDDALQIVNMKAAQLGPCYHLITTIDDMGACRVFAFASTTIFLLHTPSQQGDQGKMLISKCEPSRDGDFIGIFFESADNKTGCLEIHKCAKDVWIKELDNALEKMGLGQSKVEEPQAKEMEDGTESKHEKESEAATVISQTGTPRSSREDRSQHKFTSTNVVAKLNPPSAPQGIPWSSPIQIAKTVDGGDVLGTGVNHQVSQQHLDLRMDTFRHFHKQHLQYLSKDEPNVRQPTFHFLTPGRLMPQGLDNAFVSGFGQPTAVGVWWSGHYHFRHYSLLKQTKVEAEIKPDIVWPYSAPIVSSCVSPCTSLLAVALGNNNVIVWNKYLGYCLRMAKLNLPENDTISKLEFLDPSICPQSERQQPLTCQTSQTSVYLMICTKEGQMFLLTCANGDESPPRDISAEIENDAEKYIMIQCINGIPELILTSRVNGRVYIHNVLTGHVICEVTLPEAFVLGSPWQPVVTAAALGQMVFVGAKASETSSESEESTPENEPSMFVFDLSETPLSVYQKEKRVTLPYVTHFTVNQRIETIMQNRMSQQASRKERMERRWKEMKMELQSMKQAAVKSKTSKSTLINTTIENSGLKSTIHQSQISAAV